MATTHARRLIVAINPAASFGRAPQTGPAVVAALLAAGHVIDPVQASSFAELRDTVRARLDGADALVVVGGDGMVSLGVNLVAGTDVALGLVPSGTGNDAARGLGIPLGDVYAAVGMIVASLESGARRVDVGVADHAGGSTRFLGVLSAGLDARVNDRANRMRRPRGPSRYTLAMLIELVRLAPTRYELECDGERTTFVGTLLAVANLQSIGGGMRIAPDASIDDGLLDVVAVAPLRRLRLLRLFPSIFRGTHVSDPTVSVRRAARVAIAAPGVVAYADGERVGELPVVVRIESGALWMLAPVT